ncbi:hypothetical protein BDV96DRAFT_235557 [Lophiotrema nucula]|uniref:Mid2 domain-containing protein n=1 Tax=Lophiotrema nucula TaxID=690887 RepID=A0A6A5YQ92_9PLEO|nr:hypothetical protein BDV96DRAFT_235557 [Lophiotrema nucula]
MSCGAAAAICGTTCCSPLGEDDKGLSCCGSTCCDLSTSVCCGDTCCDKDTSFCCGDGICCKSSDACGIVVDDSSNTQSVCTRTASGLANLTITIAPGGDTSFISMAPSTTTTSGRISEGSGSSSTFASSSTTSFTPTPTGSGDDGVSGGTIAGAVIGPVFAIALFALAFFLWNRRRKSKSKESEELEMYQPAGGRHELGAEAEEKKHPQLVGNEINEMYVPPDEAGGEVIHELPGEGQPAEIGPDSPLTKRTTWEGVAQERENV